LYGYAHIQNVTEKDIKEREDMNMFWVELILVLAIIFLGVRKGGTFLAMAGGVGMLIMTFFFHVTPADPPVTVILIMIAVIVAAATMQACGGLDFLVRIAEKILRRNPRMITVLAPVVAYIFTFMCGTGHIIYSLLPVINEISIETGVRPERPISASIIASQQAITACPISAATVGILAFMAEATNYKTVNIFTLLVVCIPATLIGTVACALAVMKKGKELAEDPEFQARVASGQVQTLVKNENAAEVKTTKEAKISVAVFLVAMVGIVLLGAVSALVPTLSDGSKLPLTTVIEIFMLVAAAVTVLITKLDSNKVLDQPVFKTGMFAVVLAFGLCWLVNTFIADQSSFITDNMSVLTNEHPWIYIIAVFIVGSITTSQSSSTMIMVPIGIALGLPANIIVAGWIACSSNYFIPASGQCVAAIAFDTAGTTKIGKYVLNHSYMLPGLVCTVVSVVSAILIGAVVF
jgi:anaerobic C4-dicarboxylate transporter DcuB